MSPSLLFKFSISRNSGKLRGSIQIDLREDCAALNMPIEIRAFRLKDYDTQILQTAIIHTSSHSSNTLGQMYSVIVHEYGSVVQTLFIEVWDAD